MSDSSQNEITEQLIAWNNGDEKALDHLMPVVYHELRRMADRYLRREDPGHVLQTTALVHEAYLRLVDQTRVNWQNRAQFFGVAAQMMRRVLVDHARAKLREKRGGEANVLNLDEALGVAAEPNAELIALDDALSQLAAIDPRKCRVVEMRYFAGLSVDETALALDVSPQTVLRDWNLAKAWLYHELKKK